MAVSLRSVRAAMDARTCGTNILWHQLGSFTPTLKPGTTNRTVKPEPEAELVIDQSLIPSFAQEFTDRVQIAYVDECDNDNEPPVSWIFGLASRVNLTALVNGQSEIYWTPRKIKKAVKDGEFDEPLKIELFRDRKRFIGFEMAWVEASTVALLAITH